MPDIESDPTRAAIDRFGRRLVRDRDRALRDWEAALAGEVAIPEEIAVRLSTLSGAQRQALTRLQRLLVDRTLRYFLTTLDEPTLRLSIRTDDTAVEDVSQQWEGAWELQGDLGWIARFSEFPPSDRD